MLSSGWSPWWRRWRHGSGRWRGLSSVLQSGSIKTGLLSWTVQWWRRGGGDGNDGELLHPCDPWRRRSRHRFAHLEAGYPNLSKHREKTGAISAFKIMKVNVWKIFNIYLFSTKIGISSTFSWFVSRVDFCLRARKIYLSYKLHNTYEPHAGLP